MAGGAASTAHSSVGTRSHSAKGTARSGAAPVHHLIEVARTACTIRWSPDGFRDLAEQFKEPGTLPWDQRE
jgi:hypothetical protein